MSLDQHTVQRIARLARLAVPDSETPKVQAELERLLGFVDALAAAPVDGIEPMAHPLEQDLAPRPDAVTATDRHEALLALAPDAQGGYYLVPKVIE